LVFPLKTDKSDVRKPSKELKKGEQKRNCLSLRRKKCYTFLFLRLFSSLLYRVIKQQQKLTTMKKENLQAALDILDKELRNLNYDENGNAIDREAEQLLLASIAPLEELLQKEF